MTDKQLLDAVKRRVLNAINANCDSNKESKVDICIIHQYRKKLYFCAKLMPSNKKYMFNFVKAEDGFRRMFILPELPERLMGWKYDVINSYPMASSNGDAYVFDLDKTPKEVIHMFASAIISALNTPGVGMGLMSVANYVFDPSETYEEICLEADLHVFE